MDGPRVKGLAFRGILRSLERLHGAERLADLKKVLPPELGRLIEYQAVVTGNWYPLSHYATLLHGIEKVLGRDNCIAELSRESTLEDFRGIYKILTFVLSPETLIKRAPGLWGRYYDTGTLSVPEARAGFCRASYQGCIGFDRTLWQDVFAGGIGLLEACGAENITLKAESGGGDGDAFANITARWD
jgi:hypothetical protein